ncbi:molybdopterin molybdotransferase [Arthrobacter sp. ok909]|uniref:molybdopterin molybdotransferase MoeA n=1 Tax=Arthrobacter sp. ok909 TaxID=1761746 RepID=UPI000888FAF2|nr:molybdopterin molybdotransferase MoeA [Arthrobacter sp. ok909]SDP29001.1 molybdopterin molybdotransferase [Arthrobacter sp. ok909]
MTPAAPDGSGPASVPRGDNVADGVGDNLEDGLEAVPGDPQAGALDAPAPDSAGPDSAGQDIGGPDIAGHDAAEPDSAGQDGAGQDGADVQHRHLAHTWLEARQLAFDCATPIPAAPVPLRQALGRTLAADVVALQDMPHYASSAMDGWAVNGSGPWILAEPNQRLAPHQASRIATGGLIPDGAKAVLRSESGVIGTDEDGLPVLKLGGSAKPGDPRNGDHIRKAGEEAAAGDVLIKRGTVLNPAHLALAALAGNDTLPVLGKALVRLVLTGSEVVTSGLPAPGQVRDTFGPQLAAAVGMLGGICTEEMKIGDTYTEWLAALEDGEPVPAGGGQSSGPSSSQSSSASDIPFRDAPGGRSAAPAADPAAESLPADVVITTGGTGRSGTDHLRRSVDELGGRLLIDGIAMRPGHPAVLAELPDGRYILGLPGNPLAAMMALSTIGAPLLAALGHGSIPPLSEVPCGSTIDADPGRTRLMPFRLVYGMASPAQHTGPGMMRGLAAADGVLVVPPHGVQLGELVPAFALPWGTPLPDAAAASGAPKPAPKRTARKTSASDGPVDWSALLG